MGVASSMGSVVELFLSLHPWFMSFGQKPRTHVRVGWASFPRRFPLGGIAVKVVEPFRILPMMDALGIFPLGRQETELNAPPPPQCVSSIKRLLLKSGQVDEGHGQVVGWVGLH